MLAGRLEPSCKAVGHHLEGEVVWVNNHLDLDPASGCTCTEVMSRDTQEQLSLLHRVGHVESQQCLLNYLFIFRNLAYYPNHNDSVFLQY